MNVIERIESLIKFDHNKASPVICTEFTAVPVTGDKSKRVCLLGFTVDPIHKGVSLFLLYTKHE